MHHLFKASANKKSQEVRIPRHSSGWGELLKHLQATESVRILDVGTTSPHNINFLTGLGHSVYMANFVEDALKPEWIVPAEDGVESSFNADGFLKANLSFAGRQFDVIALWDALDYLPRELVSPLIARLRDVLVPGGKLLAFFHTKQSTQEAGFVRYHLTDASRVEMQRVGDLPTAHIFQNRQIEALFHQFAGHRFFLAKDGVQEVIVTR